MSEKSSSRGLVGKRKSARYCAVKSIGFIEVMKIRGGRGSIFIMNEYFLGIQEQYQSGHAKEHAYRPDLKNLFEKLLEVTAVNDPKRSENGAPDFIFVKGDVIFGYAEAKDIDVDLVKTAKGEQLKRYFGYSNLILTNYVDFRFYRNGEEWCEPISVAKIIDRALTPIPENYDLLTRSIKDFYSQSPERIKSASRLTKIMGGRARRIRDNVSKYLEEESDKNLDIIKIYEVIKKNLVHDITHMQFADMYAQTLVYGLFVARYYDTSLKTFTRQEARDLIPASNPFLQHFFDHLAGANFDRRLGFIIDELCEIFAASDVKELMNDYKKDRDPVIHFYEDFLFEYDNALRKKMGVFYTPAPVVSFIVRAVDEILKKDFNLINGVANTSKTHLEQTIQGKKTKKEVHRVQVLDPATGTGTFLNEIIKYVHTNNFSQESGLWNSYVNKELLPRLHGFELMMASYTIAHLKLAMTLRDTGVEKFQERLGVYLTNSLEEGKVNPDDLFGSFGLMETITKESSEAARIKTEYPVMVVVGNPPYSGISSNNFESANRLVDKYKFEAGGKEKLQERNPKWLNDDYVKFIAFAEDLILKNGEGVLGFITNHSFLDNPTFRGMRWKLAQTFSEIHIVDLHGNVKKKEVHPNGSKDENIFDIQQGVAIMIGVRKKSSGKKTDAKVFVADLYGKKEVKFETLNSNKVDYKEIELDPYQYYFVIKNNEGKAEYEKGFSVNDLFKVSGVGLTTAHDEFVIEENKEKLIAKFEKFKQSEPNADNLHKEFNVKKKTGWDILSGWKNIQSISVESLIQPISYRPFDNRYIIYEDKIVWRTVKNVMHNFTDGNNLGFISARSNKSSTCDHFYITKNIVETKCGERTTQSSTFPLYVYPNNAAKVPNLDKEIWNKLNDIVGETTPENILDYIYAVLHSPKYRSTYKEFLKTDFPRVPYPKSKEEFWNLVPFGTKLRELHLLEAQELQSFNLGITFVGEGNEEVVKPKWGDENRVYINGTQYFDGISKEVFNFYVGGYQPAQRWLKDRKGRTLTAEDIIHYKKMCVAMSKTIEIMKEIDSIF